MSSTYVNPERQAGTALGIMLFSSEIFFGTFLSDLHRLQVKFEELFNIGQASKQMTHFVIVFLRVL